MERRRAIVSQAEIKRTLVAVQSTGMRIGRVEVDHGAGRVVIVSEDAAGQAVGPDPDELLK